MTRRPAKLCTYFSFLRTYNWRWHCIVVEYGSDEGMLNDCFRLCGTDVGNVAELEKCCFSDLVDVRLEGEGGIQDDTKFADLDGGGDNEKEKTIVILYKL